MNNPIDSRQLKAFAALARLGSFTVAAKELFLSQSAVSHSMRALEEDIGCRLFDRVGKKVFLTQAGEQLQIHAEKVLKEMNTARASLLQLGKWGKSRLRVGASTTACQHIIPAVLLEFKRHYPDCTLTIEPGDSHQMVEGVMENRIDLAIGLEPRTEQPLDFHPLFEDELCFIVGRQHPWAAHGRPVREEIPRQNYILYDRHSITFHLIEQYFREENMVLNTFIELGSMEAIKELVRVNIGISIVAPWIARDEIQNGSLVPISLGRRKLRRRWGILHFKERRLGMAEETFLATCRQVTARLMAPVEGVLAEAVQA